MSKEAGETVEVKITPEIEELARFAVDEHNKKQLEFRKAIKAWQQVVAGFTYTIVLEAAEGCQTTNYEAKVWVKPSPDSKELVDFKPLLTKDA